MVEEVIGIPYIIFLTWVKLVMPLEALGNDKEGRIAIDSLKRFGVNTDYIRIDPHPTNIMNIIIPNSTLGDDTIIHSWYSPITNTRTLEFRNNLPTSLPPELLDKEIFVLLDKFETINFEFLTHIKNKKVCLDIGHYRFIEHFSKQYLTSFFKHANLIQLNYHVCDLLFERLQIQNEFEFFDLLGLDLLVITKGKKELLSFLKIIMFLNPLTNHQKLLQKYVIPLVQVMPFLLLLLRNMLMLQK